MRAKKIENKPIVNEVISDAVEVKRLKKQIITLENDLKQHKEEIEKYEKMKSDLDLLKAITHRSSGAKSSQNSHRRQTWGGDGISMIPVHVDSPCSSKSTNMRDQRVFGSLLSIENDTSDAAKSNDGAQEVKPNNENGGTNGNDATFKIPSKVPTIKKSLLAPPTSFKSPVHRTSCMLIDFTFLCHQSNSTL